MFHFQVLFRRMAISNCISHERNPYGTLHFPCKFKTDGRGGGGKGDPLAAKRRSPACALAALALGALSANAAEPAAGDLERGRALYESRCQSCHSLDHSRIGPAHRGVFGRHAGAVPGYLYSEALKHSNVVWDAPSLDQWLTNPEAFIPGQKMGYSIPDARDRADVIAFLMSSDAR